MPISADGFLFDQLTSDPGSPGEGQAWFNSTVFQFKVFRNGAVTNLVDDVAFTSHTGNSSNPHTTTLEQARSAGATLSGAINMGGFAITNVSAGSSPTDVAQRQWVIDQVNQKVAGLDWQESVLSRSATPPGSPVSGDRYLIIATATGAWVGQENKITQYNGTSWDFYTPNEGWVTRVEAENVLYTFDGTSWGNLGGAVSHTALLNLSADDHLQYLPRSGARAMIGALDMGGQSVTNVNLVDGVDVSAHASRHNPGGADALATAAPPQGIGAGNSVGTAASFARSDHGHTIRESGGTDLTMGAVADGQFLRRSGTTIVGASTLGYLAHKSGRVLAASFSGFPKKATVAFVTPFSSANYSVVVTSVVTPSGTVYSPAVESQLAGSFVINMGAFGIGSLVAVNWIAIFNGESTLPMPLGTESIQLDALTSDPATPDQGQLWYNSTDEEFRGRKGAITVALSSVASLAAVQVRRTTTLTVTSTWTDVSFDVADVVTNSSQVAVLSATQVRVLAAGTYKISFKWEIQQTSPTTQSAQGRMVRNGSAVVPGSEYHTLIYPSESDIIAGECLVTLAANDVLTAQVAMLTGTGTMSEGATFLVQKLEGSQGPSGAGSSVSVQNNGVPVAGTPHSTINFTGGSVSVTNAGGGVANVAVNPTSVYGEAAATSTTTTTSASDTLMAGMSVTPPAGTYLVWFTGDVTASVNSSTMTMSVYAGGVQAATSERPVSCSSAAQRYNFNCTAVVTVDGLQAIGGYWRRTAGTVTNTRRSLMYLKVA